MRTVSSVEPVSRTTISSTHGLMLIRQARRVRAELRTIMHSDRSTSDGTRSNPPPGAMRTVNGPDTGGAAGCRGEEAGEEGGGAAHLARKISWFRCNRAA